ncbi:MAG TPA: ATP-binding protein [Woeseiaceae bacterium]|nr:ATP-binding protein [Woeseiaceae bacterium]
MSSLSARLLVSVSVLLLLFFGATILVLDMAFVSSGERAREEILDGYLMQLLAAAEPDDDHSLSLPRDLVESRFNAIGSGLYAELLDEGQHVIWQSQSALGLALPAGNAPPRGEHRFARESLADGTPLLTLSLAVDWEFADDSLQGFVFKVHESLDAFNAQIASFRRQLFGWFGAVAIIMLLAIAALMRSLLKPLRQIEAEIGEIEAGKRAALSVYAPTELRGVARNMNLLINSERARSERYRITLDNLAHSLKTPLAAIRSLLDDNAASQSTDRINAEVERMDEIVRYQLRKPAATDNLVLAPVAIASEIDKLVSGMRKVYRDKAPSFDVRVDKNAQFRGDTGDFLELAGNLIDNACKWCERQVVVEVRPFYMGRKDTHGMVLSVADDGAGIPDGAAEVLLTRGSRLDESTPGHGIGLAIVADLVRSYGGEIKIKPAALGGANVTVSIPARFA